MTSSSGNCLPSVCVVMSAYNGEKYLKQQIESIMNQENVDVSLFIRDDGSKDNTLDVIKQCEEKYGEKIRHAAGKNTGYKKSFILGLASSPFDADFWAFADQDDYWEKNKCSKAVKLLKKSGKKYSLYASTVNVCDKDLNFISKKSIDNFVPSFGSSVARTRLAGCTMVFDRELKELLCKFRKYAASSKNDNVFPSHDGLAMSVCTAVDGNLVIDTDSYIRYRRHEKALTSYGLGIIKRLKVEKDLIFDRKNDKTYLCKIIKKECGSMIPSENMILINNVINYRKKISGKLSLVYNKNLDCGLLLGNLETKIKILIDRF